MWADTKTPCPMCEGLVTEREWGRHVGECLDIALAEQVTPVFRTATGYKIPLPSGLQSQYDELEARMREKHRGWFGGEGQSPSR